MVQVDIVWGYAFGATFSAAAGRQMYTEKLPFVNRFYVFLLHYLALFFGPSGLYLLWQFPSWETMQVAETYGDLPAWLVTLFAITNVTQGILGYYVGYRLNRRGSFYLAHANWMFAWVVFWFILVAGWDTTGWQRFLYDRSMNQNLPWQPGLHMGLAFFTGPVFRSLFVMGVIFAPMLVRGIMRTSYEGLRSLAGNQGVSPTVLLRLVCIGFGTMFGICLGYAIVAANVVRIFVERTGSMVGGYALGLGVSLALGHLLFFRRGMLMEKIARCFYGEEPPNSPRDGG